MSEVEAMALAIALGIGLGMSMSRQIVLRRLASEAHHGADFFSRLSQGALSISLLVGAAMMAQAITSVTAELFMSLVLTATFAKLWLQRGYRSRLLRR
jgi:predicted MFS family arabinose efflux permease